MCTGKAHVRTDEYCVCSSKVLHCPNTCNSVLSGHEVSDQSARMCSLVAAIIVRICDNDAFAMLRITRAGVCE